MKLAKKISKGIALCAALVIMGAMGGVITSCSNSSDGPNPVDPPAPEDYPEKKITFNVTEDSTNAENTTLVFQYTRSAAGAEELVAIEKCGIVVVLNGEFVKMIDKLNFALDEYGASFDDNDKEPIKDAKNMKDYKAKVSLGKKVNKDDTVVLYYNKGVGYITGSGKDADAVNTLMVALIDTDEDVDYYNPLVANDNNYQPLFPAEEDDKKDDATKPDTTKPDTTKPENPSNPDEKDPVEDDKEDPPATETVIYTLDFSGATPPDNHYYDEAKFEANVGAKIEGAWGNFSIVPKDDASALKDATHIRVTFKCSSDAAFADGDVDNNKFMVGLYKDGGEDNNYAETNVRWTCFLNANEDDFPKDFTLVEKKINWEQKYESDGTTKMPLADFEYTSNFRIWDCNFVTGTLIVQSIEFIKK